MHACTCLVSSLAVFLILAWAAVKPAKLFSGIFSESSAVARQRGFGIKGSWSSQKIKQHVKGFADAVSI